MIVILRNIAFALLFWGLSVPIVLATPIAALFGERTLRRHVAAWFDLHRWATLHILGIETRVEGALPDGPALYAAKHQAMYETCELTRMLDEPVVVLKRELADIPFWGWAARRYGIIAVDRAGSASALRTMLREAAAAIAARRPVLIFPEGTRVAPGEAPPLRPGFAGLYRALALPVVPIALDSARVWPRRGMKRPGIVTLRFGAPIPPGLPRREIEAAVHRAINALEEADRSA